jgi:hypothetical protein
MNYVGFYPMTLARVFYYGIISCIDGNYRKVDVLFKSHPLHHLASFKTSFNGAWFLALHFAFIYPNSIVILFTSKK